MMRKKIRKGKAVMAWMCAGTVLVISEFGALPVYAVENQGETERTWNSTVSWEEVAELLDKNVGIYEEPSAFDPTTWNTPDGPLMGNGTVLAFLAGKSTGDARNQTFYISRLDNFEELNENSRDLQYVGYGGIDITRTDGSETEADFYMKQDMKQAEVTGISESGFQTETWLSAKENIMISEITNLTDSPMELEIAAWTNVTPKVEQGISGVASGVDKENGLIYAERRTVSEIYDWSVNSATAVKLLDKECELEKTGNNRSKMKVELAPEESIHMIAAVEGGKDSETYHDDAVNKVLEYDSVEKLEDAKYRHQEWWRDYWLKSYLDLDETSASLERVYYGQMYEIGCSIQAASENPAKGVTAGLFPWTGSSAPNWQGDYTLNTDVERPISVAVTANRLDHIENYTQVIEDYWPEGVENASNPEHLNWLIAGSEREKFSEGIRGALFPTHIGPWGSRTEHFNNAADYFCSPSNGTMVLQPLVQYYKSTLDEEYLTETLYPMVREQANFWTDYAEEENGKYNIYGATYESTTAYKNATLDMTSAIFMLKNAIEFSEHLGVDEDLRTQWRQVYENMAPYPTKDGYYIEDERGNEPATNYCGYNVYGFAFYDLVGVNSPEEEKNKVRKWAEEKQEYGTHDKQTRSAMTAARVGSDPHLWLDQMKAGYVERTPDDWMGMRPNNTVGDIGGTLFSGVIMETLMQSHEGFINLFPAWYPEQEASFKNLRAYGAFTVSAYQNKFGQVQNVSICSEKGSECSVLNPWQDENIAMKVYKDGEEISTTVETNNIGDVYTFSTEAGAKYELKPEEELQGFLDIIEDETEVYIEDSLLLETDTNKDENQIIWESDDGSIATVEGGMVNPRRTGDVTVTAYIRGQEDVADTCMVHVVNTKKLPPEVLSAVADSEENNGNDGPGAYAVDGKSDTYWHSGYSDGKVKPDIWNNVNNSITITLENTDLVSKIGYLPRQDEADNGMITKYEIWYSTEAEGEDFQKISEGEWEVSKELKTVEFTPVECRRIRIRAMETYSREVRNEWISAAEFYVYHTFADSQMTDKTALDFAVTMAERLQEEQDNYVVYTEETWDAVRMALENAGTLLNNPEATQEEIDASFLELMTAINLLESDVQKAGLGAAIEGAKAILADASALADYTPESVEAVRSALAEAEAVYADTEATQTAINQAATNLMTAVNNLLVTETDNRLDILIQKAEELLQKEDQYTSDSVQALKDALEAARDVAGNKNATEQEINDAYNALAEAMASLVRVANKAELENALNKANEILDNAGKYTESSLEGLEAARDAAQSVYDDENASQEAIEEVLKALINEILEVRLLGDVNLDEAVDSADAQALLRYNAELDELSEEQLDAADVNRDEAADSSDAGLILQYAAEKIEEF